MKGLMYVLSSRDPRRCHCFRNTVAEDAVFTFQTCLSAPPLATCLPLTGLDRRFHFKAHRQLRCAEFCSPHHTENRMLWHLGDDGTPTANFNSSMAESNNAWVSGELQGRSSRVALSFWCACASFLFPFFSCPFLSTFVALFRRVVSNYCSTCARIVIASRA